MAGGTFPQASEGVCLLRSARCFCFPRHRPQLYAFDPIKALYWSAVVNGVLAPPVMVLLMLLVRKEEVMRKLIVNGWLYWVGWIATAAMALSIIGMAIGVASD